MMRAGIRRGRAKDYEHAPAKSEARAESLADFDTQLMLRVREGSSEAANALVRRNFDRVSRYISRVVRDSRSVEDLTQDVFLQVHKSAQRYEPTAKFSTWLYRIATNIALNYLNQAYVKKRRDRNRDDYGEPEIADRADSSPERQFSLDELRDRVSAAVSALPIKQRIALTLFQYEELSYEQIASVLGTTVESVRCLLTRARAALRASLDGLL